MAVKDEKGLIGFDPLAWMEDSDETAVIEQDAGPATEVSETMSIEETVTEVVAEPVNEGKAQVEGKDTGLTLDPILNIQNVGDLYEQLVTLLDNQDRIEIDVSAVETVDTATLQLFIVLKQTAIKLQKEVVFEFPSDKFIEASQLLGLAEMLDVEQAAAGLF